MNGEHLQTGTARDEAAYMDSVAVAVAGGVEEAAVVVDGTGTIDNLVASVAVNISHAEVMVTISIS